MRTLLQTRNTLEIDFLFLDLTTCSRYLGAARSLESALEVVRDVLEATDVTVEVDEVLVESEEQARAQRFVSSPTCRRRRRRAGAAGELVWLGGVHRWLR